MIAHVMFSYILIPNSQLENIMEEMIAFNKITFKSPVKIFMRSESIFKNSFKTTGKTTLKLMTEYIL